MWVTLGFAATFVIGASLYAWLGSDSAPDGYGQGAGCIEAPPGHNWSFERRDAADIEPDLLYLPSYLPAGFAVDYAWATDGVYCSWYAGPEGERLLPEQTWFLEDTSENPPGDRDTKLSISVGYGDIEEYLAPRPDDPTPGLPLESVLVGGLEGRYLHLDDVDEVAWQIAPYVLAIVHVQAPGAISRDDLFRVAESMTQATSDEVSRIPQPWDDATTDDLPYLGLDLAGWEFWRAAENQSWCSGDTNWMPGERRQAVYTLGPVAAEQHPLFLGVASLNLNVAPASMRCSFSAIPQSASDLGPPADPPAVIDHGMTTVMGHEARIVEEQGVFSVYWLLDAEGSVASVDLFPGGAPLTVDDVIAITAGIIELTPEQWADLIESTPDTPPDTTP